MRYGYQERFLHIDLTEGEIRTSGLSEGLIEKFIGGRGFAARMMWDFVGPEADPLSLDNVLMLLPGPLTGTVAPCMRSLVAFKSPLTGTYCDCFHGGFLGPEIKYAGYDGIIITGRANYPVYLYIEDDEVQIRDAKHLWGLNTYALYEVLHRELGGRFELACIGLAGEKLVRFALIDCSPHRQAGRGGGGAVMGSKNLKAMVVRGSHRIEVAQPGPFMTALRLAHEKLRQGLEAAGFNEYGTVGGVVDDSEKGALPTYNFQRASFSGAEGINGPAHKERLWIRNIACMGCPIACGKMSVIRRGRHRGVISDNVEYESTATLGSNLGIDRVEDLQYAAYLCDLYGMDTMSTGGVVGFAIEAYKRGIISKGDLGGLEIDFGAARAIHELIEKIARREDVGNLLAEGVKRASESLGGEAPRFAMHTKGLETPGYEPRGLPGHALGYATADRGGDHERGYLVHYEMRGKLWQGKPVDRFAREGKAEILIDSQNRTAGNDTLIACHFAGEVTEEVYTELLNAGTGLEIGPDYLALVGERIWNMTRLFNLREGFTRADDDLPLRAKEEGLPDPPVRGQHIPQEDLDRMLDEYYRLRGWNENGVPTEAKLAALGLDVCLDDLGSLSKKPRR